MVGTNNYFRKGNLTNTELNLAIKLIENNKEKLKDKIRSFAKGKKTKPLQLN